MTMQCDHAFKTTVNTTKFEAVVASSCKSAYTIEVIAHDPTLIPHIRVFNVSFAALEDRDRVRIAMRFLEKEQADMAKAKTPAPTLARRLASA
jgi:hypothetical protein